MRCGTSGGTRATQDAALDKARAWPAHDLSPVPRNKPIDTKSLPAHGLIYPTRTLHRSGCVPIGQHGARPPSRCVRAKKAPRGGEVDLIYACANRHNTHREGRR